MDKRINDPNTAAVTRTPPIRMPISHCIRLLSRRAVSASRFAKKATCFSISTRSPSKALSFWPCWRGTCPRHLHTSLDACSSAPSDSPLPGHPVHCRFVHCRHPVAINFQGTLQTRCRVAKPVDAIGWFYSLRSKWFRALRPSEFARKDSERRKTAGAFSSWNHSSRCPTQAVQTRLADFFLVKKLVFAAVRAAFPLPFRIARRKTRVCLIRRFSPVNSMLERRKDIDWNRFYRAFPA